MGSAAAYWWYKRRAALVASRKSSWMNSIQPPRSMPWEQTCPTACDRPCAGRNVIFHLQSIHGFLQSKENKKYTIPEPENKNPTRGRRLAEKAAESTTYCDRLLERCYNHFAGKLIFDHHRNTFVPHVFRTCHDTATLVGLSHRMRQRYYAQF